MNIKTLLQTPLEDIEFSVVDTETTGMNSRYCRVIDVGIVKIKNLQISSTWETLINPEQLIDPWIAQYTKLQDYHVKNKPVFKVFGPKIMDELGDSVFVAHNVEFDYSFLRYEMARLSLDFSFPKLCTVQLAKRLVPELGAANLDVLSDFYRVSITARHRALPDALATAEIFLKFIELAKQKFNAKTYYDLEKIQRLKITNDPSHFSMESPLFTSNPTL